MNFPDHPYQELRYGSVEWSRYVEYADSEGDYVEQSRYRRDGDDKIGDLLVDMPQPDGQSCKEQEERDEDEEWKS